MNGGVVAGEGQTAQVLDAASQAVYRCYGADGQLLYVGTTGNFGRRLADHAQKIWFLEVRGITLEWYTDVTEALAAERRAICVEQPKYNITHKSARLRPVKRPSSAPALHPVPQPVLPSPTPDERKYAFARTLGKASPRGVSPRELTAASGFGRTLTHKLLLDLMDCRAVVRVNHGRYRPALGCDIAAMMGLRPKESR